MKIKAAVLNKSDSDLNIEDVVLDDPKANEVLIKTIASGICHSDIEFQTGDFPIQLPIILGHEGAGIVEKVGPNITDFKKG